MGIAGTGHADGYCRCCEFLHFVPLYLLVANGKHNWEKRLRQISIYLKSSLIIHTVVTRKDFILSNYFHLKWFDGNIFILCIPQIKFRLQKSQLSGVVPVDLATRRAISELIPARQFNNADRVFLVIPSRLAASVTVKFNGLITSSRKISPGCVGFLLPAISVSSMIILIICRNCILTLKLKDDSPIASHPDRPIIFILAFQFMQMIAWQVHVMWTSRGIQSVKNSKQFCDMILIDIASMILKK